MRLIRFGWFYFGKMWKNMEKQPFFRADMAGLGNYYTPVLEQTTNTGPVLGVQY